MLQNLYGHAFNGIIILLFLCLTDDLESSKRKAAEYFSRGYAYLRLGKYKLALKDLDKAIEHDREYFDALINRAIAYSHLGDYENSIKDSIIAIHLNPKSSQAYLNLGLAYEKTGHLTEAKKCLVQAAKLGDLLANKYLHSIRNKKK